MTGVQGRGGRGVALWMLLGAALLVMTAVPASAKGFTQLNLISDIPALALHTDADAINTWGVAFGPTGLLWVVDNGTGLAKVYNADGSSAGLTVTIPLPPSSLASNSAPDGIVFNGTAGFVITEGVNSAPARFLFAAEDGTISGWAPTVDATNAILAVDNSAGGSVYKGIALASDGVNNFVYATDFHNAAVDVFDGTFTPMGSFTDPGLPAGFAPFGIRNIGGLLFVTYAKQKAPENHDDEAGPGNGFVVVFDPEGNVITELISHGALNSPWGLAVAPDGFGQTNGALLVGNFGDGRINAYRLSDGKFMGTMTDRQGKAIVIDGLWGIETHFSPVGIPLLYFAAGLNDEADGLVGTLRRPPAWGNFPGRPMRSGGPRGGVVVR